MQFSVESNKEMANVRTLMLEHYCYMKNAIQTILYSLYSGSVSILSFTTVFVDTQLWKTKTPGETFPKFPSVLRVIDRSDQNQPITATSVTF